jgi:hypothetical protein
VNISTLHQDKKDAYNEQIESIESVLAAAEKLKADKKAAAEADAKKTSEDRAKERAALDAMSDDDKKKQKKRLIKKRKQKQKSVQHRLSCTNIVHDQPFVRENFKCYSGQTESVTASGCDGRRLHTGRQLPWCMESTSKCQPGIGCFAVSQYHS